MSVHCINKTKAIVKVNEQIVLNTSNPFITVELDPIEKCQQFYVTIDYRYYGVFGLSEFSTAGYYYGPIGNARLVQATPNEYRIELSCYGDFVCSDSQYWVLVGSYEGEGVDATIRTIEPQDEGGSAYSLSITNKNGTQEFLKNYDEQPIIEVICGCDVETELECLSNNEVGFCCISCDGIVSKLKALKSKIR